VTEEQTSSTQPKPLPRHIFNELSHKFGMYSIQSVIHAYFPFSTTEKLHFKQKLHQVQIPPRHRGRLHVLVGGSCASPNSAESERSLNLESSSGARSQISAEHRLLREISRDTGGTNAPQEGAVPAAERPRPTKTVRCRVMHVEFESEESIDAGLYA
jgi:hypothetical protein